MPINFRAARRKISETLFSPKILLSRKKGVQETIPDGGNLVTSLKRRSRGGNGSHLQGITTMKILILALGLMALVFFS